MLKVFSGPKEHGRGLRESPNGSRRDNSLSIIGADMRIEGLISTAGVIKIEGTVVGDVESEGQVLVSAGGNVDGNLRAPEIVVGGKVHGSIFATRRTELHATSVVLGDVTTPRLKVHEGSQVNGRLQTGDRSAVASPVESAPSRGILKMPNTAVAAAV